MKQSLPQKQAYNLSVLCQRLLKLEIRLKKLQDMLD